jgi:hypothetical protein
MAVEEKAKEIPPELTVTIGGKSDFYEVWTGFYVARAPPEVIKMIEEISALGIEKCFIVSYYLSKFINEDRVKQAKDIQNWILDLKAKWIEMRRKELEKEVKK